MTPLLQQARGALAHAKTMMLNAGCRQPEISPVVEVLAALDSYEALRPYDKAIEALAPYLPLWVGWVAIHDQAHVQGLVLFDKKPELSKMGPWWNAARRAEISEVSPLCLPLIEWRESLRQIKLGRVVPQEGHE